MEVAPENPTSPRPVVARDDQTTATLLQKLLQSQERLQTKVAKLKAQARPPQITAAPATRSAFRERGPEQPPCTVQEPRAGWTHDGKPCCFGCGRMGHMHRECRQSRAGNGQKSGAVSDRPVVDLQVGGLSKANPRYSFGRTAVQNGAGRRCLTGWARHNLFRSKCVEMASKGVANATH